SEERRVGKECRSRGWPFDLKKKIKFNLTIPLQQLNGLETLVIIMVANKYAFLQITRRRFRNEWEAFKKVISRRNIRRRITIPLTLSNLKLLSFFFQAEDGIRDLTVTGVQTCALPISEGGHLLVRQRDLRRRAREQVAALGAAPALDQPGLPQPLQDVLEELQRDVL